MSSTIQHRYNLRSTAKRALKQPVIEEPIIKISIFMYLLNMIAYFLETFSTPEVYKNMFKRQSEQDAINMQQEQEQEQEQEQDKKDEDEDKEDKEDQEQEDEKDEDQEDDKEDKEDKEDEDQEQEKEDQEEDVEQIESLSHTNIYGLIKIIKKYIKLIDNPETRYLKQRRY